MFAKIKMSDIVYSGSICNTLYHVTMCFDILTFKIDISQNIMLLDTLMQKAGGKYCCECLMNLYTYPIPKKNCFHWSIENKVLWNNNGLTIFKQ